MSESNGIFVDIGDGGKPGVDASAESTGGNAGRTYEPEIINGYDTESPDTERIAGADGVRFTKSGKPDGRSSRRRRTFTSGTPGETAKEQVHLSSIKLEDVLYSIHLMGAEILKTPELELDKAEAKKLSDAVQEVGKFYALTFDPKKVAIFNLAIVAGGIYGTRLLAIRNRQSIEKQVKPGPVPAPKPNPPSPAPSGTAPKPNGQFSPSQIFGDMSGAL